MADNENYNEEEILELYKDIIEADVDYLGLTCGGHVVPSYCGSTKQPNQCLGNASKC